MRWDRRGLPLDHRHQPRRRDPGAIRLDGQRVPAEAETARHRRDHGLPRARLPHQPLGLRLHRRRPGQPGGQAGRDHRYRRDRHPVRAAPRRGRWASCSSSSAPRRRSTCAATGRPTRSGSAAVEAGLAAPPHRELPDPHRGRRSRRGPGRRRLDEHRQETVRDAATQRRRNGGRRPFARSRNRRLRQDGGDPGPRRRDRDRPRHRRGAQTLVRLLLQATVLPRRIPADVQPRQRRHWSTPMAVASSGSPRTASSSTASNTPSTA